MESDRARRERRKAYVAFLERQWAETPDRRPWSREAFLASVRDLVGAWERGEDLMMGHPRPDQFGPVLKALDA